jgi:hypothetical protein
VENFKNELNDTSYYSNNFSGKDEQLPRFEKIDLSSTTVTKKATKGIKNQPKTPVNKLINIQVPPKFDIMSQKANKTTSQNFLTEIKPIDINLGGNNVNSLK